MNRNRLLPRRDSITHRVTVNGFKVYFTVGLFPDGQPGELFIHNIEDPAGRINDDGMIVGLAECWAIAISMLLQSEWSLEEIAKKFSHTRFGVAGFTDNPDLRSCQSIVDYIVRWMVVQFEKKEAKEGG